MRVWDVWRKGGLSRKSHLLDVGEADLLGLRECPGTLEKVQEYQSTLLV